MTEPRPGDNRPAVYEENGLLVVRASALGSCLWELIATAQGLEPQPWPQNILRAFDEGHDREQPTLDRLESEGWRLDKSWAQREVDVRVGGNRVVRVHPDSAGFPPSQPTTQYGIEVKWLHNSSWSAWRRHGKAAANTQQKWQFSCEMAATRLPLVVVVGNKGETPDENGVRPPCPHEGELHFEFYDEPPFSLGDIIKRVKELHDAATSGHIVASERPCDTPSQYPCRFIHLRPEPEHQGVAVPEADAEEFERWASAYERHARLEKEHKSGREEARDQLTKLAGKADDLFTNRWAVHLSRGESTTTNWKQLCADNGIDEEVIDKYRKSTPKTPTVSVEVR